MLSAGEWRFRRSDGGWQMARADHDVWLLCGPATAALLDKHEQTLARLRELEEANGTLQWKLGGGQ